MNEFDPDPIVSLGLSFWRAKVVLTAIELGLFAKLVDGARSHESLTSDLGLQGRGAKDFFDALVGLGLLVRENEQYEITPQAARFLVPGTRSYIGGVLEMANSRLYPVWGKLGVALRTGRPQNEANHEDDYYANLGRDPDRLRTFLSGMTGLSMMAAQAIAEKFPWKNYRSFIDVGGAQGGLSVRLAQTHDHLVGGTFELPHVEPFHTEYVASFGVQHRIRFHAGDFFADSWPPADVYVMGHVLHNWDIDQKHFLIRKAYEALRDGGALIVYEALIDDERRSNLFGLLMSLNMLLVTQGGSVFTAEDCQSWMRAAGFEETSVTHLHGADSMVVAIK